MDKNEYIYKIYLSQIKYTQLEEVHVFYSAFPTFPSIKNV